MKMSESPEQETNRPGNTGEETVLTGDTGEETVFAGNENPAEGENPEQDTDTEGAKAEGDGSESDDGAPETYADFSFPEGVQVDQALLDEAAPIFKELGLTQEQAQKLVDLQSKSVQASAQQQLDTFEQVKSDWLTESQNDPEFGGEKFEKTVTDARLFIDKFGDQNLKDLLEHYGIGNNIHIIKPFAKAAALLKEDDLNSSGSPVGSKANWDREGRSDRMYPQEK
jgi:hypothetical protein